MKQSKAKRKHTQEERHKLQQTTEKQSNGINATLLLLFSVLTRSFSDNNTHTHLQREKERVCVMYYPIQPSSQPKTYIFFSLLYLICQFDCAHTHNPILIAPNSFQKCAQFLLLLLPPSSMHTESGQTVAHTAIKHCREHFHSHRNNFPVFILQFCVNFIAHFLFKQKKNSGGFIQEFVCACPSTLTKHKQTSRKRCQRFQHVDVFIFFLLLFGSIRLKNPENVVFSLIVQIEIEWSVGTLLMFWHAMQKGMRSHRKKRGKILCLQRKIVQLAKYLTFCVYCVASKVEQRKKS